MQNATSSINFLSSRQLADYCQNGYLVLRGLIDQQTVSATMDEIDNFILKNPTELMYEPEVLQKRSPESLAPEERLLAVRGMHNLVTHYQNAHFLKVIRYRALVSALISILGDDIKLLQDMTLLKPPHVAPRNPRIRTRPISNSNPLIRSLEPGRPWTAPPWKTAACSCGRERIACPW